MRIYHQTAPEVALAIAFTGQFWAGPILGDSGLNAILINDPRGKFHYNIADSTGATIAFDWNGPVLFDKISGDYQPEHLYDEFPFRAFIPVGTSKNLKLSTIELSSSQTWGQALDSSGWLSSSMWDRLRDGFFLKDTWRKKVLLNLESELQRIIKIGREIKVVFPPSSAYEGGLRERNPNISWPIRSDFKFTLLNQLIDHSKQLD